MILGLSWKNSYGAMNSCDVVGTLEDATVPLPRVGVLASVLLLEVCVP